MVVKVKRETTEDGAQCEDNIGTGKAKAGNKTTS